MGSSMPRQLCEGLRGPATAWQRIGPAFLSAALYR
jgi:hypothetical protein